LTVVGDGEDAISLIDAGFLPNLVILDLNLPRVGGLDVLRKFRSTPDTCDLPIVIFSSSPTDCVDSGQDFRNTVRFKKPGDLESYWSVAGQFRRFYESTFH
jgi:CheY-like chemotaxis protein